MHGGCQNLYLIQWSDPNKKKTWRAVPHLYWVRKLIDKFMRGRSERWVISSSKKGSVIWRQECNRIGKEIGVLGQGGGRSLGWS